MEDTKTWPGHTCDKCGAYCQFQDGVGNFECPICNNWGDPKSPAEKVN